VDYSSRPFIIDAFNSPLMSASCKLALKALVKQMLPPWPAFEDTDDEKAAIPAPALPAPTMAAKPECEVAVEMQGASNQADEGDAKFEPTYPLLS